MVNESTPEQRRYWLQRTAFTVEGGLLVAAVFLGWLLDCWTPEPWEHAGRNALIGLVATVPFVILLPLWTWLPQLKRIDEMLDEQIIPIFKPCTLFDFAWISLLAGLGEEAFFRVVLQGGLEQVVGGIAALLLASVVFGLAHLLSPAYAVITGIMGLYLGTIYLFTDSLLAVAITHGLYDFIALVYLVRIQPSKSDSPAA